MLLAAHLQGPARDPDRLAYLRDIKRLFRISLHHPVKPAHDDLVMPLRHAVLANLAVDEAADHRLDQRLLQPTCGIRIGDDFRGFIDPTPLVNRKAKTMQGNGWLVVALVACRQ